MRVILSQFKSFCGLLLLATIFFTSELFALELPNGYTLIGVIQAESEKDSLAVIATPGNQSAFLRVGDSLPGFNQIRISLIARNRVTLTDGTSQSFLVHDGSRSSGDRNESYANSENSYYDRDEWSDGGGYNQGENARPNWDESMVPVPNDPNFDQNFPIDSVPYDGTFNEMPTPRQGNEGYYQDEQGHGFDPYLDPEGIHPHFNDFD